MQGEEKNLKDLEQKPMASYGAGSPNMSVSVSYNKTNKLITALYMVTDIIDKEEPLRLKLRTLGAEVISDIHVNQVQAINRISETMSFLDIASAINLISEMNCNILKKEFILLQNSVRECRQVNPTWLEGFLEKSPLLDEGRERGDAFIFSSPRKAQSPIGQGFSKGHLSRTRIGVQKGSTLLKALSNVGGAEIMSDSNFHLLKKQRREDLLTIIKNKEGGATIKDIKLELNNRSLTSFISSSEKTLQRELVSMVKDGVLNKTGEKRWSKYFLS